MFSSAERRYGTSLPGVTEYTYIPIHFHLGKAFFVMNIQHGVDKEDFKNFE